jgi:hypothetical protein
MKPEPSKTSADQQAKREAARKPSKDDVHEQREANQHQEGVVQTAPRPPQQSQIDAERADWEGMGQSRYQPEEDKPKSEPTKH